MCKETSLSPRVTISAAKHQQNQSIQADCISVKQLMCHTVSVADVAVEVGESLLAADSERHNRGIARTPSVIPAVTAELVQSIPVCTNASAAAVAQDSAIREPEQTAVVHQQPDHETSSIRHTSESPPAIVIVPDGSTSPGYHLSCDEHHSCDIKAETSGPLVDLSRPETFLSAEPVVCYPVTC